MVPYGWRRSADRARLQGDSLVRGNLSGKYQIFRLWGQLSEQNTAVVRRLVDQFPMKFNKENISWIREMFDRNSEFYGSNPDAIQRRFTADANVRFAPQKRTKRTFELWRSLRR